MDNYKIFFMGTPPIAGEYLNFLIKSKINISAVYSQPPTKQSRGMKLIQSAVHKIAITNSIDTFTPKSFDNEALDHISKIKPDLIIVMAYGKILPKKVLEIPKYGCINLHVSLLPRWRGAAPIEHTLMNGDLETGISIIKLVEKLDAGPIIAQKKILIPDTFNKLQLSKKLTEIGTKLLVEVIPLIFKEDINFIPQKENLATYANKLTTENRKINFNNSSKHIINQIRAFAPKPGAWFNLNKERIKIIDAKKGKYKGKVSTILNEKFEIGCEDGSIEPLILQREGKNIISKDEFLRGYKINLKDKINAEL